jgi:23S rRNA (uracil1939-C5)-methyltransferase
MNRRELPVFERVTILDAGSEGKAVARVDNRVVFVPFVVPGDVVDIQITKKKKSYQEGKAIRFHTLSEKRAEPFCSHFGLCGGCRWQHMSYEAQLFYKQKQVEDSLRRIGKIENPLIHPIVPSPRITHYRNKLEYTFSNRRWFTQPKPECGEGSPDRNALGFHMPAMFDRVLDIEQCHLQEDPSNAIRLFIRHYAVQNGLTFYDVLRWEGFLRNLLIRNTSTGELMVILVVRDDQREVITGLLDALYAAFPQITSLYFVVNPKKNDVIHDLPMNLYKGSPFITEVMEPFREGGKGLTFRIGPVSFFQTNPYQAVNLYRGVAAMAGLTGNETVYDLYTGTGTIGLYIAPYAREIIGIESVAAAVEDAEKNAGANGILNAHFFAGEVEQILTPEFMKNHGHPDLIITDPPRTGMHGKVIRAILDAAPAKIIYVSCNPATQARDLQLLAEGYTIVESRPFDMFPQTHHVENVTLLTAR